METDPLSDVLRAIRLTGGMFLRVHMSPPFAVVASSAEALRKTFAPDSEQLVPFHLVSQGPIWFHIDGNDPVELNTDDILVLPRGAHHGLSDALDRELVVVPDILCRAKGIPPTITQPGQAQGDERKVLCGFFACRARLYSPLLDALPDVVIIRQDSERTPWLIATLKRTFDETLEKRPGGRALIEQLVGLLFMEIVQKQLVDRPSGWLRALSDPILGRILQLIHNEPGRDWTVQSLAERAGTSRSVVAERFVDIMDISPIRYLTNWRLEMAAARLLDTDDSIGEIARDIGYHSEASFSRAFKRHVGAPPATWRHDKQQVAACS